MKKHATLNRIYRLVWSQVNNCWVAVAETAKGRGKSTTKRKLAAIVMAMLPTLALAGLDGGVIVGGQGVIVNPNLVQQNSSRLAINAQGFGVGVGETFTINQNLATDLALIRVWGQNPSNILGSINAKGQLFVSNPNGVLFGTGAQVNVGGLVATSLDISSDDFMAGNITFYNRAGAGSVINKGNLTAAEGGYIALLAPEVRNEGIISATLGKAVLASGDQITLTLNNGALVEYNIDKGTVNGLVENKHLIQADGGQVFMSGKAADALTTSVVNNTGIIRARTVQNHDGVIKLMGDMQTGTVNVGGTLDASAPDGGNGGFIETSAAHVKVANGTHVTTLAANVDGGTYQNGTWLIDPQDYTIGAGGDITGATLSTNLGLGNVSILSSGGGTAGNGDIFVNDAVSWSANNLTLTAARDINVNAVMTASGTSTLDLNPATANGADAAVAGGTVKMGFNPGGTFKGRIDLPGRSGAGIISMGGLGYTVIDSLGAAGSMTGLDLQGINGGLAGRYVLGSNIDASATSGWNAGLGFAPISIFTGNFNGLGHTVNNLYINRPATDKVGLFGDGGNAKISNVGLESGSITGQYNTGGLVGYMDNGSISNSYTTSDVVGNTYVGGLVGNVFGSVGSVSNSHARGNVYGVGDTGGLAGNLSGTMDGSYATGDVTGEQHTGGLVGHVWGAGMLTGQNYATGNVTGTATVLLGFARGGVGGLIGAYSSSTTLDLTGSDGTGNYATGNVTGWYSVGGLVGLDYGNLTNVNNNVNASGTAGSVTGLDGGQHVGGLVGWKYAGTLNITNSTAGVVTASTSDYVGGLVGSISDGTVLRSYYMQDISGRSYLGGLVGESGAASNITESFAMGNVTSADGTNVGGLVGLNAGVITDAYATGATGGGGSTMVGGLVGDNAGGSITRTYATGAVSGSSGLGGLVGTNTGTVADSYWDTQTSGQLTSAGGTGKTTAEMKAAATYSAWNIDDIGGTGKTWRIYNGSTAPLLRHFLTPITATLSGSGSYQYDGLVHTASNLGVSYSVDPTTTKPNFSNQLGTQHLFESNALNAGNYALLYSNQLGYDVNFAAANAITITPAPLTITAGDASTTYNGLAYGGGNGVSYNGFVNGETSAVLSGSLTYGGSSQGAIGLGSYLITPSGFNSSNYNLTYVDGTLTIKPETIVDTPPYKDGYTGAINVNTGSSVVSVNNTKRGSGNSCVASDSYVKLSDQRFAITAAASFELNDTGALALEDSALNPDKTSAELIASNELTVTLLNDGIRYPDNRIDKTHEYNELQIAKLPRIVKLGEVN
ncbi:MAG: filamentous hemagglutinin N-terminal domain-containing protein [Methylotenera sp.]